MGKNNKSGKAQNVQSSADEVPNESHNFLVVLFYCLLLIFSPIVSFFGSKVYFDAWASTPMHSNIYSAVFAVVVLHLALGLYLYRASQTSSVAERPRRLVQQKED